MSNQEHGQWLPVVEAAEKLGITENELRIRLFSGTVRFRRGDDDVVYVFVDNGEDAVAPPSPAAQPAAAPSAAAAPSDHAILSLEAFGEIKSTYEAAVELLRAEMRRQDEQHTHELERVRALHEEEIRRFEQAREQALDRVLTACEQRVDDLQKAHDAEITYLREQIADGRGDQSTQAELDMLRQQRQELLKLMQALTGKLHPDAQNQAIIGARHVRFTVVPDDEDDAGADD